MYEQFVRERITELRMSKGVSEYKMSQALGKSRGYIYNISSGKALPPLKELFYIMEYFEITPAEFFDERSRCPHLVYAALGGMSRLNEDDMETVLSVIGKLCVMREAIDDLTDKQSEAELHTYNSATRG